MISEANKNAKQFLDSLEKEALIDDSVFPSIDEIFGSGDYDSQGSGEASYGDNNRLAHEREHDELIRYCEDLEAELGRSEQRLKGEQMVDPDLVADVNLFEEMLSAFAICNEQFNHNYTIVYEDGRYYDITICKPEEIHTFRVDLEDLKDNFLRDRFDDFWEKPFVINNQIKNIFGFIYHAFCTDADFGLSWISNYKITQTDNTVII